MINIGGHELVIDWILKFCSMAFESEVVPVVGLESSVRFSLCRGKGGKTNAKTIDVLVCQLMISKQVSDEKGAV